MLKVKVTNTNLPSLFTHRSQCPHVFNFWYNLIRKLNTVIEERLCLCKQGHQYVISYIRYNLRSCKKNKKKKPYEQSVVGVVSVLFYVHFIGINYDGLFNQIQKPKLLLVYSLKVSLVYTLKLKLFIHANQQLESNLRKLTVNTLACGDQMRLSHVIFA